MLTKQDDGSVKMKQLYEVIDLIRICIKEYGGVRVDVGEKVFWFHKDRDKIVRINNIERLTNNLKDLKPEIKVKKLVYMEHDNPNGPDYYTGTAEHYKIAECGLRRFWISRTDLDRKEPFLVYDSLQEAQDHVQKLWDVYVLSFVEVK
jgi:hypothetical protein